MYKLLTTEEILKNAEHLNLTMAQKEVYVLGFMEGSTDVLGQVSIQKDKEIEELKQKSEELRRETK